MTAPATRLPPALDQGDPAPAFRRALFNILEDSIGEKEQLASMQTAALNIMEDFSNERARFAQTQTAVLNILEDSDAERAKMAQVQTATLNILQDFDAERVKLRRAQSATLNILEDFDAEKNHLAQSQRAMINMLEDIDLEKTKATAAVAETEAVNKELDEFAYVASHDLKAPLRVIDNASRWLEEDLAEHLTPETRDNMNLLRGRVRRMEKLLDDLLEYSRVGRKFDDRYQEIVSGTELTDNIVEMLAPPEGFTLAVSPNFAGISVARMPLQQILMNLIGNAIKHHDKKVGRIDLTVEDEGEFLVFAVKDDGPGIPKEYHDKIFKMFQTLKPRDQVEGSGMGLAIIKKHLDYYGGTIEVDSDEGKGSTFRFTWPKRRRSGGAVA